MQKISSDVIIIGAGLTGLTLAYLLTQHDLTVNIIEARERLGGRIHTQYGNNVSSIEMGATWLGKKHSYLTQLLEEVEIGIFEQILGERAFYEPISTSPPQLVSLPPNTDPSFRIKGGSSSLIRALADSLQPTQLHTQQVVQSIRQEQDFISVASNTHQFHAKKVVSTLPPYLLSHSIDIHPALPDSVREIAQQTHTWMGESIKIGLTYETPFWRDKNLSGTIFSSAGPIPEMYDHSNFEDSSYALKGFLNGAYYAVSKAQRLELIMNQLEKYFGKKAQDFVNYEEVIWRNEAFTYAPYKTDMYPHQNNGHPAFGESYLNGNFFIAGSETAAQYPGYMEGAIRSAYHVYQELT